MYCSQHLKTGTASTHPPKTADCALQEVGRSVQDQPLSTLDGFRVDDIYPSCLHGPFVRPVAKSARQNPRPPESSTPKTIA